MIANDPGPEMIPTKNKEWHWFIPEEGGNKSNAKNARSIPQNQKLSKTWNENLNAKHKVFYKVTKRCGYSQMTASSAIDGWLMIEF